MGNVVPCEGEGTHSRVRLASCDVGVLQAWARSCMRNSTDITAITVFARTVMRCLPGRTVRRKVRGCVRFPSLCPSDSPADSASDAMGVFTKSRDTDDSCR